MILMLNNRDSFVFNLGRYFTRLGQAVETRDSDGITIAQIRQLNPSAIVISPGPSTPAKAGISLEAISVFAGHIPILGVCLGHQAIAEVYGGAVRRAISPCHGRAVPLTHSGVRLFSGVPADTSVGLYHSLIAEAPAGGELVVDATSPSGEIMALSHRTLPVYGVQFHPESILTGHGEDMLRNFLALSDAWKNR